MTGKRYKTYLQPAFLICVGVLAVAAAGMKMTIHSLGVQLRKLPLPLQKPLTEIDEALLGPYKVVDKVRIENADMLAELGTEDYIQWTLEDTEAEVGSSLRYCSLFVTYYTGNPDQVPHVPEECYFGGGYQRFAAEDELIEIGGDGVGIANQGGAALGGKKAGVKSAVPVRCLVFGRKSGDIWSKTIEFPVLYFFKANGEYASSREQVRRIMSKNLFSKYSYYSKVEWRFFNTTRGGAMIAPSRAEAIAGSSRLLETIVGVLERDHWPDWSKAGWSNETK